MNTGDWKRRPPQSPYPAMPATMRLLLASLRAAPASRITQSHSKACGMYLAADGRLYPPLTVHGLHRRGLVEIRRGLGPAQQWTETVHLSPDIEETE